MKPFAVALAAMALSLGLSIARAQEASYSITLQDHKFSPATVEIPAGKKVKLVVKNLDSVAEEFDSDDLHREKVVPAGKEVSIYIGPLKPGTYRFQGEYNPKTAVGAVVVK